MHRIVVKINRYTLVGGWVCGYTNTAVESMFSICQDALVVKGKSEMQVMSASWQKMFLKGTPKSSVPQRGRRVRVSGGRGAEQKQG